jgi:hypothetical protein
MMFNDDHDCRHAKCLNARHLHDHRLAIIGISMLGPLAITQTTKTTM